MARPIDYSKWKDIEISDDEDDTHPNIDTPSLFKWRHEARIQRMKEFEDEKRKTQEEKERKLRELEEAKQKLKEQSETSDPSLISIKKALSELEKEKEEAEKKWEEIQKQERLKPWNVDTISQEGFSKTAINKQLVRKTEELTEEEKEKRMRQFVKDNEKDLKAFGWLSKYDDSKRFLLERPHLACEETANFLVIHCLNLAIEEKYDALEQVAHQCICIQYLLELSKQLDIDPRSCISSFFSKIQIADPSYKQSFDDELKAFKDRIRRRAAEKIQEQIEEARLEEERERQERLGPGGLDPSEVYESLPDVLKECFDTQDIEKLQLAIKSLPESEARYHMKRCVDSGLWVPSKDDTRTNPEDGFVLRDQEEENEDDEIKTEEGDAEPVYEVPQK